MASPAPTREAAPRRPPAAPHGSVPAAAPSPATRETASPIRRPLRAARSTLSQRCAARSAARSARGECASARRPLTSLPVSIPSGQASRAGAVGGAGLEAVVGVLLEQRPRDRASRRAGGRSRAAGRSAPAASWSASRLGQTGSHIPHSTQAVTESSTGGFDFRSAQVYAGVAVEQDARCQHAVGVGELLHLPHHLASPWPPTRARRRAPCCGRSRARPSASRRTCRRSARPARR